jgi:predicted Fe-S protein YdhL (DUF1289 family)
MTSVTSRVMAEVVESKSPCVNVCHLENKMHDMICIGCLRTQEEIADWMTYTELEKDKVLWRIKNVR